MYEESKDFIELVPHDKMELGKDVLDLLSNTLIRESKQRPTAIELLSEPIIIEGVPTVYVEISSIVHLICIV